MYLKFLIIRKYTKYFRNDFYFNACLFSFFFLIFLNRLISFLKNGIKKTVIFVNDVYLSNEENVVNVMFSYFLPAGFSILKTYLL